MPAKKFQLPLTGFPYGLNTEASTVSSLPGELLDGSVNVKILANGSLRRRFGVDFFGESAASGYLQTVRTGTKAVESEAECPAAVYVQFVAPNGSSLEKVVVDINNEFWVYDVTVTGLKNFDSPDQVIARSLSYDAQKAHDMSYALSGKKLYFAGQHTNPGYLSVDTDNVSIIVTYIDTVIRDTAATKANVLVRRTISAVERWFECIESHTSSSVNAPGDGSGDWQQFWHEKFGPVDTTYPVWATSTSYTSTMIKVYDKDVTPTSESFSYPTVCEFYAGRLWLSGDVVYPNRIYFSQVIEKTGFDERFYAFAEPFNTNDSQVVASDGGVLEIQGVGSAAALIAQGQSLFVGTDKGVFQISGTSGAFKATEYSSHLVLSERIDFKTAFLKTDQEICVFGQNAIWISDIKANASFVNVANLAEFRNITTERVNGLYADIPLDNKRSSIGIYDGTTRLVYWFYNASITTFDTNFNSDGVPKYFTNCLVFDTRFLDSKQGVNLLEARDSFLGQQDKAVRKTIGAFYLYEFADTGASDAPYIAYPINLPDVSTEFNVLDGSANNVIAGADNVLATGISRTKQLVMFIALRRANSGGNVTVEAAFGKMEGAAFTDWSSDVTYSASFTSRANFGIMTMGDFRHRKGGMYVTLCFNRVEDNVLTAGDVDTNPGGAYLRTAWDWSTGTNNSKYGAQRQVYFPHRYAYTYDDDTDPKLSTTW